MSVVLNVTNKEVENQDLQERLEGLRTLRDPQDGLGCGRKVSFLRNGPKQFFCGDQNNSPLVIFWELWHVGFTEYNILEEG